MTSKTIPWRDVKIVCLLKDILSTIKNVLFQPTDFFSKLNIIGGFVKPILFVAIARTFGKVVLQLWTSMYFVLLPLPHGAKLSFPSITKIPIILTPIIAILIILIESLALHFALLIICKRIKSIQGTLKVRCYSTSTSVLILNPIPILNVLICFIWEISVIFVGLKQVHGISNVKCALGLLLGYMFLGVPATILSFLLYAH